MIFMTPKRMQRTLEKLYSSSMNILEAELTGCAREISALKVKVMRLEDEVNKLKEKGCE
ncbi:MAG: hypothetical protein J5706_04670 [Elusimicrobiales bacterium]|nr:hypothetical protein [Elusimicrobiales bacterium]